MGIRRVFRSPGFGFVWSSNLLQFFGAQIHLFTLQWLVTDLTASRAALGTVVAIQGVMVALFSPMGGLAADRFDNRALLALTRLGNTALIVALVALLRSDWIPLGAIFAAAAAGGLLNAVGQPATQTLVFGVVDPTETQRAVALNLAGIGLGQMAGPALAGVLIAGGGIVASWSVAGAGLLVAAGLLWAVAAPVRAETERPNPWRELRDGFVYVIATPPVLLGLCACLMAFFNGAIFAMRPVFARHVLGVGSEGMGAMAACAGLGTLLGALSATALPRFRRPGLAIASSMLAFSICVLLYAFAFSYAYILAVEFASGFAAQIWQISTFSGLQMAVPERLRGRVMGIVFMVAQLSLVGGAFVGSLADRLGDQLAMGIFGAIPVLALVLLIALGHRTLARLGEAAGRGEDG